MESSSGSSSENALLDGISSKLTKAFDLYENVYGSEEANQQEVIHQIVTECKSQLEQYEPHNAREKATCLYLRGKAEACTKDNFNSAHEYLSKAVKLDPSLVDAWNCLGELFSRKKDYGEAENCFNFALQKEKNKYSLRRLSMLLRTKNASDSDLMLKQSRVRDSIKLAHDALALDVADGQSWYILGNAYLSSFFLCSLDPEDLMKAMNAYKQANKDPMAVNSPDLHFNRGTLLRFSQEFDEAYQELLRASQLDATLPALEQCSAIEDRVEKICDSINSKVKLKPKKLLRHLKEIPLVEDPRMCSLSSLNRGINAEKVVIVKVMAWLSKSNDIPHSYVVMDREGSFMAVSVYNIADDAIRVGHILSIAGPFVKPIHFQKSKNDPEYQYDSVQVWHPKTLLVNGNPIPDRFQVGSQFQVLNQ